MAESEVKEDVSVSFGPESRINGWDRVGSYDREARSKKG